MFEQLFRKFYEPLCQYALKILKEPAQSEEIVQDVFFRIWEKRGELNIETSEKSYLYRAVHNSCLNHLKHLKVRQKYQADQQVGEMPTEEIADHELEVRIREAIRALPENQRQAFELSRTEGLKYSQIADEMGISVKTVESYISKSLKHMRQRLADYLPFVALFLLWIKKIITL